MLDAALQYAASGRRVFPAHGVVNGSCTCGKDHAKDPRQIGKHPATANGFKAATTDETQIRAWWGANPNWNVAIATGHASGLLVIDADIKTEPVPVNGKDSLFLLEEQHGPLPEDAPVAQTGSGGYHIMLAYPQGIDVGSSVSKLGSGVDIRAERGYIVAPPSLHRSGVRYSWLVPMNGHLPEAPEWVYANQAPGQSSTVAPRTDPRKDDGAASDGVLKAAKDALGRLGPAVAGSGGDQRTFAAACVVRNDFALPDDQAWALLTDWNSTCLPPWDLEGEGSLRTKFDNAGSYPKERYGERRAAIETLESLGVRDTGEEPEAEPEFAGSLALAKADLQARGSVFAPSRRMAKLTPETMESLETKDFPSVPWLVGGLLVKNSVVAIAGEPKTTKTWCGLELGVAVAGGGKAFGEFAVQETGPVVFFLVEDDERSVRNRLRALAHYRKLSAEGKRSIHVFCRESINLGSIDDVAWLVACIRSLPVPPVLVVFDPLRDLHDVDEDSSNAMSAIGARLRAVRDVLNCAVIFIHHSSKAPSTGVNTRRPGQRMRGSSAIHGFVDGGLYLSDLETDLETYWQNNVSVEVKAARGAGTFALTLSVEDDVHGQALRASWKHGHVRETPATLSDTDKIAAFLRAPANVGKAFGVLAIKNGAALKGRFNVVAGLLRDLKAQGRVEEAGHGEQAKGWRATDLDEGEGDPMISNLVGVQR